MRSFLPLLPVLRALAGRSDTDDRGQTTAEYALVLVAVAVVVGLFIAWASGGALTGLFDAVLDRVRGAV